MCSYTFTKTYFACGHAGNVTTKVNRCATYVQHWECSMFGMPRVFYRNYPYKCRSCGVSS